VHVGEEKCLKGRSEEGKHSQTGKEGSVRETDTLDFFTHTVQLVVLWILWTSGVE